MDSLSFTSSGEHKLYLKYTLFAIFIYLVIQFFSWFLEPYSVYKKRKMTKEFECFMNGKTVTKAQLGTPFLLRSEQELQSTGKAEDALVDLSLVVPAYNEEDRLPEMLREHIDFIEAEQKKESLPSKIEIIVVDDGSRDKTWDLITSWVV